MRNGQCRGVQLVVMVEHSWCDHLRVEGEDRPRTGQPGPQLVQGHQVDDHQPAGLLQQQAALTHL